MFSSPVTGSAITEYLTSPTFTVAASAAPESNGKAVVVTALGGTQGSVEASSVDRPFTVLWTWPKFFKTLDAKFSAVAGLVSGVPANRGRLTTRKSVMINTLGGKAMCTITTEISVPAGCSSLDAESVASALSLHVGTLYIDCDEMVTNLISGINP